MYSVMQCLMACICLAAIQLAAHEHAQETPVVSCSAPETEGNTHCRSSSGKDRASAVAAGDGLQCLCSLDGVQPEPDLQMEEMEAGGYVDLMCIYNGTWSRSPPKCFNDTVEELDVEYITIEDHRHDVPRILESGNISLLPFFTAVNENIEMCVNVEDSSSVSKNVESMKFRLEKHINTSMPSNLNGSSVLRDCWNYNDPEAFKRNLNILSKTFNIRLTILKKSEYAEEWRYFRKSAGSKRLQSKGDAMAPEDIALTLRRSQPALIVGVQVQVTWRLEFTKAEIYIDDKHKCTVNNLNWDLKSWTPVLIIPYELAIWNQGKNGLTLYLTPRIPIQQFPLKAVQLVQNDGNRLRIDNENIQIMPNTDPWISLLEFKHTGYKSTYVMKTLEVCFVTRNESYVHGIVMLFDSKIEMEKAEIYNEVTRRYYHHMMYWESQQPTPKLYIIYDKWLPYDKNVKLILTTKWNGEYMSLQSMELCKWNGYITKIEDKDIIVHPPDFKWTTFREFKSQGYKMQRSSEKLGLFFPVTEEKGIHAIELSFSGGFDIRLKNETMNLNSVHMSWMNNNSHRGHCVRYWLPYPIETQSKVKLTLNASFWSMEKISLIARAIGYPVKITSPQSSLGGSKDKDGKITVNIEPGSSSTTKSTSSVHSDGLVIAVSCGVILHFIGLVVAIALKYKYCNRRSDPVEFEQTLEKTGSNSAAERESDGAENPDPRTTLREGESDSRTLNQIRVNATTSQNLTETDGHSMSEFWMVTSDNYETMADDHKTYMETENDLYGVS